MLHPDFPKSPYEIINPNIRWTYPSDGLKFINSIMPPLVEKLRIDVKEFRDSGYSGATETSRHLLNWWFRTLHFVPGEDGVPQEFKYYFAQREALETIVFLHDVVCVKDEFDLMRFDSSRMLSSNFFEENWRRYVIKLATGTGKTKVISLVLAWSYFHKFYESNSDLARNFLLIAPNIIVLDRIYHDFQGLKIFYSDPVIPDNGFAGRNWREDFQLTLHKQDNVHSTNPIGNIFLTNIHRVYINKDIPDSPQDENSMDYFLGKRPTGATTDSKIDVSTVVRNVDELMIINDEAHHIHDMKLAWFQSIQDIHNRLLQKGCALSMQVDVTATPKRADGTIFAQTIVDYPLVEAISQNVVKHPILPDKESCEKLAENQSTNFAEKYADYLNLGVIEWRKAYEEHRKLDKKAILFVMTDDTKNCDIVANYLSDYYPDLHNSVLVIHTKQNGEISEASTGRAKKELEKLRKLANEIDKPGNPYKAIVSVLMLKEGWDVKNVTTIVGLRAFSAPSKILPEQTLGRGLRKMYSGFAEEIVSVVGTNAFMEFVESIQVEGVELERRAMGENTQPKAPLVIEVDYKNEQKIISELDIEIPLLTPQLYRDYKNLLKLDIFSMNFTPVEYRHFNTKKSREIVFRDITTDEVKHVTHLDPVNPIDSNSVIGFFARLIFSELRLVSGYEILYAKIKQFAQNLLFGRFVDLRSPSTLRNLSESVATRTIIDTFKKEINKLTIREEESKEGRNSIILSKTPRFAMSVQENFSPEKSVFNLIVGDSNFEIRFASFLETCQDVASYAKNYFKIQFKLDYVNAAGEISNYFPDFLVKLTDGRIFIVETKGRPDLDTPLKIARLRKWCQDVCALHPEYRYEFLYVDQETYDKTAFNSFFDLTRVFREYQPDRTINI